MRPVPTRFLLETLPADSVTRLTEVSWHPLLQLRFSISATLPRRCPAAAGGRRRVVEAAVHWDYRPSTKLLMQYLDGHMLPGYAALEAGQITGYAFCVYEETKAVIGDVFAVPSSGKRDAGFAERDIEEKLLRHLFETLLNSPQVDRIESQLLLHPSGTHSEVFLKAGFRIYRRLFGSAVEGAMDAAAGESSGGAGIAALARRRPGGRGAADLRSVSRPSRRGNQRPVPVGSWLATVFAEHCALLRLRSVFRAVSHVVRIGPGSWSRWFLGRG